MSDKLTRTQRILRPVINWLVETYFPTGVFYGAFNPFDAIASEEAGSVPLRLAPMSMVKLVSDAGGDQIRTEINGMTIRGVPVGDWIVRVERKGECND